MTSGVSVADEVIRVFNDMKVRKSSSCEDVKKRVKAILFCLSEDKKAIVIETGKVLLIGDLDDGDDPYKIFISMLPENDCRYALYDATYETKECKKEDLVFLFWAPECAPLKSKMIYASSKDGLKKKLTGIKFDWQANNFEDVKDRCHLASKLGGSTISTLEGKPV